MRSSTWYLSIGGYGPATQEVWSEAMRMQRPKISSFSSARASIPVRFSRRQKRVKAPPQVRCSCVIGCLGERLVKPRHACPGA